MNRKLPISVVVLTYNEEQNIRHCLESVKDLVDEIFIVDSGSNDKTLQITKDYTDKIHYNQFETHSKQWNWALGTLPIRNDWILGLDADQAVTPELAHEMATIFCKNESKEPRPQGGALKPKFFKPRTEIPKQVRDDKKREPNPAVMLNLFQHLVRIFAAFGRHTFHPRPQDGVFRCDLNRCEGYYIKRRQMFLGKWIRHGGYYPYYLLKLFRKDCVKVEEREFIDHHFYVKGNTGKLKNDLIEWNHKEDDLSFWIDKHNKYATFQAIEEISHRNADKGNFFGNNDQRRLWLKNRIWRRLPLFGRPFLYFLYRYFFRLGFLDGKEGLIFHFLQGFWYRFLVDAKIYEMKKKQIYDT